MFFDEWFTKQMSEAGYGRSHTHDEIASQWMNFTDGREDFHVMYLRAPMSPEAIKIVFDSHNLPVLFVVDVRAMPTYEHVSELPKWVRVLHAIYYGRIYVYNDLQEHITACHFDWDADTRRYSEAIDITGILFTDTDCKLRDFPGVFHIARFYDRAFWKESAAPPPRPKRKPKRPYTGNVHDDYVNSDWSRQNYSTAGDNPSHTEEDIREAFKRYYEEAMRQRQQYEQRTYNAQPNRYSTSTGDKWLQQFVSAGNLATARTLYKQLAKEWHPDLNPGKPQALETMQAINIAFDRVKDILR